MGDHLVLYVDRLVTPQTVETLQTAAYSESCNTLKTSGEPSHAVVPSVPAPSTESCNTNDDKEENIGSSEEENPLIQMVECRICQEEDHIKNLETPCACSGSLKYAHRACVQRWCNEKGDIICEICHEAYKHNYTALPQPNPDETTIDISGGWTVTGTPLDLHDPRILAMAAAQRHILEAEYDEYASTNASGAAFCRSVALILMALLLLRHALTISDGDGDDDASAYFSLFLLRAAGFLLPCYIMAWAISILQRRRQRQEAAALAASEVAFILQSGQGRGVQFTIAPESPTTPHQEPSQ
ncbi:uncharacterized protein A4U43_C08F24310 [Asparagus officinalis]|uniref:uncharacterized protein LOC109820076 n=1 Tax=Asparagus officinalis TaxID=4686 RepID=UPI00098E3195|nr:uncharacterized protein LOC109820076 [Asparagus officinalis]ONK60937.1 uncharacterized protein A4U43_C08F24310 [Asparagus officinalis]